MKAKWESRFFGLAKFVAGWSKDPNAKVGAVIVAARGAPVALGFNGFPVGVEDSAHRLTNKEIKLDMVVHAEQNALLIAGNRAKGADIFVWGKAVCSRCAGLIIQSGIARVYAANPDSDKGSTWFATGKRSVMMFREAGVRVKFLQ